MKKIWTDFNEPNPMKIRITSGLAKYLDLRIGERVILYEDEIQVEAIIEYDNAKNQWYGKIDSAFAEVPVEIIEAREDGFINGRHFGIWTGRENIIINMLKYNIDKELIIKITGINREYLNRL